MSNQPAQTSTGERVLRLRHGTTKIRAESIMRRGPDLNYVEKHGGQQRAQGFSTAPVRGPFPQGSPEQCAVGKARAFPDEGGAAILEVEVPERIVSLADDLGGEIRFTPGYGLEELLQAWPSLNKEIKLLT